MSIYISEKKKLWRGIKAINLKCNIFRWVSGGYGMLDVRIDNMNERVRELCGVKKGIYERIKNKSLLRWFDHM